MVIAMEWDLRVLKYKWTRALSSLYTPWSALWIRTWLLLNQRFACMNHVWLQDITMLLKARYSLIKIILLKYLCQLNHEAIDLLRAVIWFALWGMYKLSVHHTINQLEFETKVWDLKAQRIHCISIWTLATFGSKTKVSYLALLGL